MFSLKHYEIFKRHQERILVATNLLENGIDLSQVNVLFNYDIPEDIDTYIRRVCLKKNYFFLIKHI